MYLYTAHTLCKFALATLYFTLPNELHSLSAEMRLKSLMKSDTFVVSTCVCYSVAQITTPYTPNPPDSHVPQNQFM